MAKTISQRAFLSAVKSNDIATVRQALGNGVSPNFECSPSLLSVSKKKRVSPIFTAVKNSNVDMVELLLSASANPNPTLVEEEETDFSDKKYVSPLLICVRNHTNAESQEDKTAARKIYIVLRLAHAVICDPATEKVVKDNINEQLRQPRTKSAWDLLEKAYEHAKRFGNADKPVQQKNKAQQDVNSSRHRILI